MNVVGDNSTENADFAAHARLLGGLEGQALYNAANFSVGVINDVYGEYANSTVSRHAAPGVPLPVQHLAQLPDERSWGAPLNLLHRPGNSYFASLGSSLEFEFARTAGGPPNGVFQDEGAPHRPSRHHRRVEQHGRLRRVEARHRRQDHHHDPPGHHLPGKHARGGHPEHADHVHARRADGHSRRGSRSASRWRRRPASERRRDHGVELGLHPARRHPGQSRPAPQPAVSELHREHGRLPDVPRRVGPEQLPPRRGQRPDVRRLGEVPQEQHQHDSTIWALGSRAQGEIISADSY